MWISKVPVDPATYDKNFLAPLPQGDQSFPTGTKTDGP